MTDRPDPTSAADRARVLAGAMREALTELRATGRVGDILLRSEEPPLLCFSRDAHVSGHGLLALEELRERLHRRLDLGLPRLIGHVALRGRREECPADAKVGTCTRSVPLDRLDEVLAAAFAAEAAGRGLRAKPDPEEWARCWSVILDVSWPTDGETSVQGHGADAEAAVADAVATAELIHGIIGLGQPLTLSVSRLAPPAVLGNGLLDRLLADRPGLAARRRR